MLLGGFLFMLAGTVTIAVSAVAVALALLGLSPHPGRHPRHWPAGLKRWVLVGGGGMAGVLLGMFLALLGSR